MIFFYRDGTPYFLTKEAKYEYYDRMEQRAALRDVLEELDEKQRKLYATIEQSDNSIAEELLEKLDMLVYYIADDADNDNIADMLADYADKLDAIASRYAMSV